MGEWENERERAGRGRISDVQKILNHTINKNYVIPHSYPIDFLLRLIKMNNGKCFDELCCIIN